MTLLEEIATKLGKMPEKEKRALYNTIKDHIPKFIPSEGPQFEAYYSKADILLYGGAGGGGKSALGVGLAINEHQHSAIARRQYTDLSELITQAIKFNGTRDGFNGSPPPRLKTTDGRIIDFIAAARVGDEERRQGIPIDYLYVDEASQFQEAQITFWMGWLRIENFGLKDGPMQRVRMVMGSNPPLSSEGQWLIEWFAPWLDPAFPNPALPGELRWRVTDEEGKYKWVDGPASVLIGNKLVTPTSLTFIPAALKNNPFLAGTGYEARLDAMPEPLRSAIRDGNFMAARRDDERQVIPSAWVREAQARWTPTPPAHAPMCAMGVDVARGGEDETVIACRYDGYYDKLIVVPGSKTPLGSDVAALVFKYRKQNPVIVIDMGGGYGGAPYEHLKDNLEGGTKKVLYPYNGANSATGRTKDRTTSFYNKRAETWWKFREALDPDQPQGSPIALPPDPILERDLTAPLFEIVPRGIKIEDKDDIRDRLGRSPDRGDAVVMAWSAGEHAASHGQIWRQAIKSRHRPQVNRGHDAQRR